MVLLVLLFFEFINIVPNFYLYWVNYAIVYLFLYFGVNNGMSELLEKLVCDALLNVFESLSNFNEVYHDFLLIYWYHNQLNYIYNHYLIVLIV